MEHSFHFRMYRFWIHQMHQGRRLWKSSGYGSLCTDSVDLNAVVNDNDQAFLTIDNTCFYKICAFRVYLNGDVRSFDLEF